MIGPHLLDGGLAVLILLTAGPIVLLFFAEILAATRAPKQAPVAGEAPPFAVLIPAHDESLVLARTLHAVMPQLRPCDRVLVVADNCTDDTAEIAEALGALVTRRADLERRGKGFALQHGVEALPPGFDVIVIVDADCVPESGALSALAARAHHSGVPTQGDYQMALQPDLSARTRMSLFAFRVKNLVRPLGSARLGLPCLLAGSGMAFPAAQLASARLGTAEIVEDLVLTIEFALDGIMPRFCPEARIHSFLPEAARAQAVQRKRWEQGHLSVIRRFCPRLIGAGVRKGSAALVLMGLDVAVPPLSLLVAALSVLVAATAVLAALTGECLALGAAVVVLTLLLLAIGIAWRAFGRDLLSGREFLAFPAMILCKIPMYLSIFFGEKSGWVKTRRDG